MEIVGPCFMPIKDGRPFNRYEVVVRIRNAKGIYATRYFFKTLEDAETYLLFLYQQEGCKDIDRILTSSRTYKWEKRQYEEFRDSIDWEELPRKIKNMNITEEHVFVEMRLNNDNRRNDSSEY